MAIFGMATAGWRPRAPAPQRVRSPCPSYYHPRAHTVTEGGRSMKKSLTRIRTSHVGRLPPPKGWEDMPARLANAELTDPASIAAEVTPAIAETVKKRVEAGIDCIGDGPQPRPLHRAFHRHRGPPGGSGRAAESKPLAAACGGEGGACA